MGPGMHTFYASCGNVQHATLAMLCTNITVAAVDDDDAAVLASRMMLNVPTTYISTYHMIMCVCECVCALDVRLPFMVYGIAQE